MRREGKDAFFNGVERDACPCPNAAERLNELRATVFRYQKRGEGLPETLPEGPDPREEWFAGWDEAKEQALQSAADQGAIARRNKAGPSGDVLPVGMFHVGLVEHIRDEWLDAFDAALKAKPA